MLIGELVGSCVEGCVWRKWVDEEKMMVGGIGNSKYMFLIFIMLYYCLKSEVEREEEVRCCWSMSVRIRIEM